MYSKIYEFCKIKNKGTAYKNGIEITPRVKWIIDLLDSNNIEYIIDEWGTEENKFNNIILPGNSGKFVTAHHDIVNPLSDNANDNSASIINAIMTKVNLPNITVILLDGEEIGGQGSQRASDKINDGEYGKCDWILNYELTGLGGTHFFIGNYENDLNNHIKSLFNCPVVQTPFNDSCIFNENGIISTVINPLPPLKKEEENKILNKISRRFRKDVLSHDGTPLDFSILYNCHSTKDNVDSINVKDMQDFVEKVSIKILS
jgi:hypothetical protein